MKKILLLFLLLIPYGYVFAENDMSLYAKSAILIDADSGYVLYEKDSDIELPMASMTKMMTMLLIMEEIDKGNLRYDEMIRTSEHASSMGGSQIFLKVGEEMSVSDLLKGIAIASGNDAAVSMAERIGGTEDGFVEMMNNKAKELGLKHTNFENACGLDSDNHYSSARDMSLIAKELVKYKKILEYTGTYEDYLRKDSANSFWLVNTNKLVRYYSGVDGLKTGYTKKAGYCITTTALKNNMRLIAVVMGEESSTIRNSEVTKLLDYGFNTYKVDLILKNNKKIMTKRVNMGMSESVDIVSLKDIKVLNNKNASKRNINLKYRIDKISAPVKKGEIVGKIDVIENKKVIATYDASVSRDINKANIFVIFYRNLLNIVSGNM